MSVLRQIMAITAAALLLSACVASNSGSESVDGSANAHPECAKQFGNGDDGVVGGIGGKHACF